MNKLFGLVLTGLVILGNANFVLAQSTTADSETPPKVLAFRHLLEQYRKEVFIINIKMAQEVAKLQILNV